MNDSITNLTDFYYNNQTVTNIPSLVANNVAECYRMFENCVNLQSVRGINFPNCTNFSNSFANCMNLTEVLSLNLENATNIENTFHNCFSLTTSFYTNITNSLPNAANLTNQYLSSTGLNINAFTEAQITILNNKGYLDTIPKIKKTYYNIYYNTIDEV